MWLPCLPFSGAQRNQDGDGETDQDDDVDAGSLSTGASGPGPPGRAGGGDGGGVGGWGGGASADQQKQQQGLGVGGCVKLEEQARVGGLMEVVPQPKGRLDKVKPEAKEVRGQQRRERNSRFCTCVGSLQRYLCTNLDGKIDWFQKHACCIVPSRSSEDPKAGGIPRACAAFHPTPVRMPTQTVS